MRKSILVFCVFFTAMFMFNVIAYAGAYAVMQVDNPKMIVNGEIKTIEAAPIIQNGRTFVPALSFAKALGGKAQWYGNEKKITITADMVTIIKLSKTGYTVQGNGQAGHEFMSRLEKFLAANENVKLHTAVENLGGKFDAKEVAILFETPYVIDLWVDRTTALVNNEEKKLDVPPVIINGYTMIPLSFIGEHSGFYVKWVESTKRIIISNSKITPEFEANIVYPPAIEKPKPAPETKQSNQKPSNSGGDPRLSQMNSAADAMYEAGLKQVDAYRSFGVPVPSSAYNTLRQALSTYQQTVSLANQLGLSNDPEAIHAKNRINEIRRIMGQ